MNAGKKPDRLPAQAPPDAAYNEMLLTSRRLFLKQALGAGAAAAVAGMGWTTRAAAQQQVGPPPPPPSSVPAEANPYTGWAPSWQYAQSVHGGICSIANGNVTLLETIVQSETIDLRLFFNSRSIETGPLGDKWSHTFLLHILSGSGYATFVHGDGSQVLFTLSGSTYTAPAGSDRTLVKNADNTWQLGKIGGSRHYHFLSNGKLNAVRKNGTNEVIVQCTYDGSGNLTQVQNGPETVTLAYSGGRIVSITDRYGRVWTLVYTSGRLTQVRQPALNGITYQTTYAYDASGRVTGVTDHLNQTWTYAYNSAGQLTGTTDPDNISATFAPANAPGMFQAGSSVLTAAPQPGQVGTIMPDESWPIDVSTTGGATGSSGLVEYGFDSSGRLVALRGATPERCVYDYDAQFRLTGVEVSSGASWAYTYDSAGRRLTATDTTGLSEVISRDASGRVVSVTEATVQKVQAQYDTAGNLTQATSASGVVAYSRDAAGRVAGVTNQNSGESHAIAYDAQGYVASVNNPLGSGGAVVWTNGLITQVTDPRGRVTNFQYDAWRRRTRALHPTTGRPDLTWQADANNRIVAAGNAAGAYTFGFGREDLMTSMSGPYGSASAVYSANGRQASAVDAAARSHAYAYDAQDRINSITVGGGGGVLQYTYNADGQLATEVYPNGAVVEYGYDSSKRLVSITHRASAGGAILLKQTKAFSGTTGSMTSLTELPSGAVTQYTYDSYGRLLTETRTGNRPYSCAYTYDSAGRVVTAVRIDNGVTTHNGTYQYGAGGLLVQVVDQATAITETYEWYADGSLASFTGPGYRRRLEYNEEGQLVSISRDYGGGNVQTAFEYAYDTDGLLQWRKDYTAGTWTSYTCGLGYLGGLLTVEYQRPLAGGTWVELARWIHGVTPCVSRSGQYFHGGPAGGPQVVTNGSAASVGSCVIDLFGLVHHAAGVLSTGLPGRLVDEGVTIEIPDGRPSIRERRLVLA